MNLLTSQADLSNELKKEAMKLGFSPVGIAKVPGSERLKLRTKALNRWLKANHQAEMGWMEGEKRKNISDLLKDISSVLVVGLNYHVTSKPKEGSLLIGRYAWGKDYHKVIKKRLKTIGLWLKRQRPNCEWRVCVDSSPLLEKAWAEEAGIGWIGKHSNLINPERGSWMALGYLLCTEELIADKPAKALCGACDICIKECPTHAITEPFVIDSRKCIAYHTIENRNELLPKEIAESMGNWVAGCDICQEVCPWNTKDIVKTSDPDMVPKNWLMELTVEQVLSWDEKEWGQKLKDSALKRIKPWMWRRNALATKNNVSINLKTK